MVVFLVTEHHGYTLVKVREQSASVPVRIVPYRAVFSATRLPRATYVFTDLDRLPLEHLGLAADVYRRLCAAELRVLNDPARVPSRFGLLRRLHEAGLNHFNAYKVEERVRPDRWPVFLRCEGGHEAPLTGLLPDWDAAQRAIDGAMKTGAPLASLLLVEYAAAPVRPGLFRKLASFQMGPARFAHNCVHDDQWVVKYGKKGIAGEDLYVDELRIVRENPYGEKVREAFALADIEYGRADFGLVDGEVQIYEINTNPDVKFPTEHPSPHRVQGYRIFEQNYLEALKGIDSPEDPGTVRNESRLLAPFQRRLQQVDARARRADRTVLGGPRR